MSVKAAARRKDWKRRKGNLCSLSKGVRGVSGLTEDRARAQRPHRGQRTRTAGRGALDRVRKARLCKNSCLEQIERRKAALAFMSSPENMQM